MRGVISKIFFKKSLLWDIYQKQRTKCISNISILFLYNFVFFFFLHSELKTCVLPPQESNNKGCKTNAHTYTH